MPEERIPHNHNGLSSEPTLKKKPDSTSEKVEVNSIPQFDSTFDFTRKKGKAIRPFGKYHFFYLLLGNEFNTIQPGSPITLPMYKKKDDFMTKELGLLKDKGKEAKIFT